MHSSYLLLLISLTLTFLTFNVESRTCVCAEFFEDECEAAGCCWNDRPTSGKNDQGDKGKCRSQQYCKCQKDPKCTLAANDPRFRTTSPTTSPTTAPTTTTSEPVAKALHSHAEIKDDGYPDQNGDIWNGKTASQECKDNPDNCDWPYDCKTGVFHKYAIDVTVFELAAKKMDQYERQYVHLINDDGDDAFKLKENNSVGSVYESLTGLQIFAGISFIIILISAMIYYQCKKDDGKKYIPLATMDGSAYATFDDEV